MQNVTRLCQTKSIVTVNGQFPGPRIIAREGDRLLIKVVNHVQYNVTIHWYETSISYYLKGYHFITNYANAGILLQLVKPGMESGNYGADGPMDLLMSHSVRFRQGNPMYTTSPLQAKEGPCFGMHISLG